jgi:hypothetical protein
MLKNPPKAIPIIAPIGIPWLGCVGVEVGDEVDEVVVGKRIWIGYAI